MVMACDTTLIYQLYDKHIMFLATDTTTFTTFYRNMNVVIILIQVKTVIDFFGFYFIFCAPLDNYRFDLETT